MYKRLKKLILSGLALVLAVPCHANPSISITYNGEPMQLDGKIKRIESTILLPLRNLSQSLGYTVNWEAATSRIDIIEGGKTINLTLGENTAQVGDEKVSLSVPPQMIDGVTYVPLRFVGEALDLKVDWQESTQTVNLESKYTLDRGNKQLLVRTKDGKQILAPIHTLNEYADATYVSCHATKYQNEIVSVSQLIQGAAGSGTASTTFYIKEGRIVDQIEKEFNYAYATGVFEWGDTIVFNEPNEIKVYDDQSGTIMKVYDLDDFQEGLNLELMKIGKNYIMGRYERTLHIIDLETGQITRILDLIPEEDQGYVFQSDMYLNVDDIKLVWETDTDLVFKYYSITKDAEQTVSYRLGQ